MTTKDKVILKSMIAGVNNIANCLEGDLNMKIGIKGLVIACLFAVGFPFSSAHAGNMDQRCTCYGKGFENSNVDHVYHPYARAFAKAVDNCVCLNATSPTATPISPADCPSGLMQVGELLKQNCKGVPVTIWTPSVGPHNLQWLSTGSSEGSVARVSCEIVRVCRNALGH